ncbi:TPA: hypothetical protein DF272_05415 [Candidatus Falkowbacteria bacterium]|nr:hypothetical protein [Candidatus Falkowbacteria bacterium]
MKMFDHERGIYIHYGRPYCGASGVSKIEIAVDLVAKKLKIVKINMEACSDECRSRVDAWLEELAVGVVDWRFSVVVESLVRRLKAIEVYFSHQFCTLGSVLYVNATDRTAEPDDEHECVIILNDMLNDPWWKRLPEGGDQ